MQAVAEDLFGELHPEQEIERASFKRTDGVRFMLDGFRKVLDLDISDHNYGKVRNYLPPEYTARDISAFSLALQDDSHIAFQTLSGMYLNELIDCCPETEFDIYTEHLSLPPWYLGQKNKGEETIRIHGNAGEEAGAFMKAGKLHITGDARALPGSQMEGGEIIVEGNTIAGAGQGMTGGRIVIKGSRCDRFAAAKTGGTMVIHADVYNYDPSHVDEGEMHFEGEFSLQSLKSMPMPGGKIFHKGKLVFWRGEYR